MPKTVRRAKNPVQTSWQKSLGPVADLEAHLPDDWWNKLFNSLYLKTDGDVVENDDNTRREVDALIAAAAVTPDSRMLDICCGQGRHVLELARRGFRDVSGLDRSRYLIRLARRRAAAEGLTVTFREGDARQPRLPADSFDCVSIMGNSFGYFSNKQDDQKVLAAVGRLLRQSGTLVIDLADGDWLRVNHEPRSWEWIDAHHFVCRERSLASDGERLVSREVIVHDELGVLADQFYAERLYTIDSISDLLTRVGFRNIRVHEQLKTRSERDQDLGMMARRIVLSAITPVNATRVTNGHTKVRDVAVLLGDPRLPDQIKRDGRFNPEDHETVRRLKDALAELKDYRFHYLDHHRTLLRDLAEVKADLIFNLCDEGWNNNAFMELNVPAVLEVFGLPYTGAAPRCLAACYDKALVRAVASQLDIPVPLESYVRAADQGATLPSTFPALLKPNFGDSSEGITQNAVVHDESELVAYLDTLRSTLPDRPVLVQEFLPGAEFTVGLIGNPESGFQPLPVLEVDYSGLAAGLPPILGYESKWLPDSPYWTQITYREASLADEDQMMLIDSSVRLFERLACRDYARFDFRADRDGTMKLLDVNPNPGWCWDGKFNLMAGMQGLRYPEMLEQILQTALHRIGLSPEWNRAGGDVIRPGLRCRPSRAHGELPAIAGAA